MDEALEDKMVGVAQREEISSIHWTAATARGGPGSLCTPYGTLKVLTYFRGTWSVWRDDAELVHAGSPFEALFTSVPAAKTAALLHLRDGFEASSPYRDGLWWKVDQPAFVQDGSCGSQGFPVDPTRSDEHEWGREHLKHLIKKVGLAAEAFDENLRLDLEAEAKSWRLPPPKWRKRTHGCFQLSTPYGELVVRRLIGWTVERNGASLVWYLSGRKVIFDKLEHAQTSALLHARDRGGHAFVDGTRWDDRPTTNQPESVGQRLSAG